MEIAGYWIYSGERRPVIVFAKDEQTAVKLVQSSPHYDGFGDKVYRVEEFSRRCLDPDFSP